MRAPRSGIGFASLLIAVLIVLAVGVGSAIAAIPNADGKYYACRVTKTGTVRLINYPKVSTCPPGQKLFSWNAQGPAGPTGLTGPAGPTAQPAQPAQPASRRSTLTNTVSASFPIAGLASTNFDFACPVGKVTGGGFYTSTPIDVSFYGSLPLSNNTWRVWARNTSAAPRSLVVWAQCMTTDPGTVIAKFSPSAKKAFATATKGAGNKKGR